MNITSKKMKKNVILLMIVCAVFASTALFAQSVPDNLRCEYLVNPLGIDTPTPRLSWLLNDSRHGALQTAYRIVVGVDSVETLKGRGNVWNTRKVVSDKMLISYAGEQLLPFTRYFWNVTYDVTANATADFYPPAGYRINKAKLSDGQIISLQATEQGVYRLASGHYEFEMKK
jgi:hypothetical protein